MSPSIKETARTVHCSFLERDLAFLSVSMKSGPRQAVTNRFDHVPTRAPGRASRTVSSGTPRICKLETEAPIPGYPLYPLGFWDCHFQEEAHISSMPS